jgi:hypothetical protein
MAARSVVVAVVVFASPQVAGADPSSLARTGRERPVIAAARRAQEVLALRPVVLETRQNLVRWPAVQQLLHDWVRPPVVQQALHEPVRPLAE